MGRVEPVLDIPAKSAQLSLPAVSKGLSLSHGRKERLFA
jgi:hypothetical protein